MIDKEARIEEFENSIDWNIKIYPFIFHIAVVNWQGSGKDLMINADIYEMYRNHKSIFDEIIRYVFNRPKYVGSAGNIYANCKLNKVYGDDYYHVESYQDIKEAHDGILYLHDAERYFNSLGLNMRSEDGKLIDFINNKRKDNIMLRLSLHRFTSIHVRIRELIPMWVLPDLFVIPNSDEDFMRNYVVRYKVCSSTGKKITESVLKDLPMYAFLYDTLDKAVMLKKDL
jgi:hypothetical protein